MKVYEFLTLFNAALTIMARNGISQDDTVYMDVYKEYVRMLSEGLKEADIWLILSKKYKLSASTIKRAIKRLNQTCEL